MMRYIRLLQLLRLGRRQHAQGGAHFHVHFAYFTDHFEDALKAALPTRQVSPRSAHAEAGAAIFLRFTCSI